MMRARARFVFGAQNLPSCRFSNLPCVRKVTPIMLSSREMGRAAVALVVATMACVVLVVTLTMPGSVTELESDCQKLFQ